jgi:Uma2 family endonuclease
VASRFTTATSADGAGQEIVSAWRKDDSIEPRKAAYERFGIPSYWVVDPDLDRPGLCASELDGGSYAEVARVTGGETFRVRKPFDVEIVPERLVAKLRGR